ncbi:MAG: hypothetical protein OEZ32_05175 [Nitrospinota bacterium]|nr:hypothetical protein [Nitrospinota bacterium]
MIGALETVKISGFDCPSCSERLFTDSSGPTECPSCGWQGQIHILNALREKTEIAGSATPDMAVCAVHPTKQAIAVCAGTGDYICSLCAVEVDGNIFGADYLSKAGRKTVAKSFARHLDRPDGAIGFWILLTIFIVFLGPLFIPLAIHSYTKAWKLRKNDAIFKRVCSRVDITVWGLILFSLTALYTLGLVAIFMQ